MFFPFDCSEVLGVPDGSVALEVLGGLVVLDTLLFLDSVVFDAVTEVLDAVSFIIISIIIIMRLASIFADSSLSSKQ